MKIPHRNVTPFIQELRIVFKILPDAAHSIFPLKPILYRRYSGPPALFRSGRSSFCGVWVGANTNVYRRMSNPYTAERKGRIRGYWDTKSKTIRTIATRRNGDCRDQAPLTRGTPRPKHIRPPKPRGGGIFQRPPVFIVFRTGVSNRSVSLTTLTPATDGNYGAESDQQAKLVKCCNCAIRTFSDGETQRRNIRKEVNMQVPIPIPKGRYSRISPKITITILAARELGNLICINYIWAPRNSYIIG